jgi:glycosyltransferase involved in cell wall biosynthesis
MSYVVAQLGARMHYAVPRILHTAGQLEHLFTDLYAESGWPRWFNALPASIQPASLRRVAGRVPKGVPSERITAFNLLGLRYANRRRQARSSLDFTRAFLWAGRSFCRKILSCGLGEAKGVYVFNTAGLEVLEAARAGKRRTVLEQTIAPLRFEHDLLQAERERFPAWQKPVQASADFENLCRREEAEWREADTIVCGSAFVRDGIAACGGPREQCLVVPYGVDQRFRQPPRANHDGPLRVLIVGAVGLRKGTPHVLAAARMLRGKAAFRLVGGMECDPTADGLSSGDVELAGSVPHTTMLQHFAWADVFLLPSLCEGSATAIYEALSASLPVICTPNCGSVVRDGVDGIIVPIRNAEAIAEAVLRLADDPALRRQMAENAGQRAAAFDFDSYGRSLLAALEIGKPGREAIIGVGR